MAMETLVVGKCGNASTPVKLIKGDNYTQKIMMRVPRYFGGVDISPLAWSVTVENAAGATDQYALSAIRGENAIEMEWIPGGTATAVPGLTKFKLSGYAQDGSDVLIWQSGDYFIRVNDTFEHVPGAETQAALTEVQKLIIFVEGSLNEVVQAGQDARAAAIEANKVAAEKLGFVAPQMFYSGSWAEAFRDVINHAMQTGLPVRVPAGEYDITGAVEIVGTGNEKIVITLDPGAHLNSTSGRMFKVYNCSFSVFGGVISSGIHYPDRAGTKYTDGTRKNMTGESEGVIELYGCHDCRFEGITVPYSSSGSVILIYGKLPAESPAYNEKDHSIVINGESVVPGACTDICITGCSFTNTILSAIHVLYHNKNIVTDGCVFKDSLRPSHGNYAYSIYTGVKSVSKDKELYYTPTDGFVVRNCYVKYCEGTAIDSHAASNVLYENNVLEDCDSFITAYHDYRRVRTAEGWVMENIIVRNNKCRTTHPFDYANNAYPHNPFLLHNLGPEGTMRNIIVENNVIDTNYRTSDNNTVSEMASFASTDGILIRNNAIKYTGGDDGKTVRCFGIEYCSGVVIENQKFEGDFDQGVFLTSSVCRIGAIACRKATFSDALLHIRRAEQSDGSILPYCSVVDMDGMTVDNGAVRVVNGCEYLLNSCGKPLYSKDTIFPLDGNIIAKECGYYGKNNSYRLQDILGVDDKFVTTKSFRVPAGTQIRIGDGVYQVVDITSRYVSDTAKNYVYELDRAVEEADAGAVSIYLAAPYDMYYTGNAAGMVLNSTDFDSYTTPGAYLTNNRVFEHGPFDRETYSRLEVSYSVTGATVIQKLYAPTESVRGLYMRFKMSSGNWTAWYKLGMTQV